MSTIVERLEEGFAHHDLVVMQGRESEHFNFGYQFGNAVVFKLAPRSGVYTRAGIELLLNRLAQEIELQPSGITINNSGTLIVQPFEEENGRYHWARIQGMECIGEWQHGPTERLVLDDAVLRTQHGTSYPETPIAGWSSGYASFPIYRDFTILIGPDQAFVRDAMSKKVDGTRYDQDVVAAYERKSKSLGRRFLTMMSC